MIEVEHDDLVLSSFESRSISEASTDDVGHLTVNAVASCQLLGRGKRERDAVANTGDRGEAAIDQPVP